MVDRLVVTNVWVRCATVVRLRVLGRLGGGCRRGRGKVVYGGGGLCGGVSHAAAEFPICPEDASRWGEIHAAVERLVVSGPVCLVLVVVHV
jgi:hypothetical protein